MFSAFGPSCCGFFNCWKIFSLGQVSPEDSIPRAVGLGGSRFSAVPVLPHHTHGRNNRGPRSVSFYCVTNHVEYISLKP